MTNAWHNNDFNHPQKPALYRVARANCPLVLPEISPEQVDESRAVVFEL